MPKTLIISNDAGTLKRHERVQQIVRMTKMLKAARLSNELLKRENFTTFHFCPPYAKMAKVARFDETKHAADMRF